MLGFNGLALFIALRMWLSAQREPRAKTKVVRASKLTAVALEPGVCLHQPQRPVTRRLPCISGLLVVARWWVCYPGLFGVGGGF